MHQKKLPIGYWLKRADTVLTEGINAVQAEFGLNRTQWQIINTFAETRGFEKKVLIEVMKPFVDENQLFAYLDKLIETGTVIEQDKYYLTEKGQRLHAECLHRQKEFREKALLGVSKEEYELTLSVLEKIVNNLA